MGLLLRTKRHTATSKQSQVLAAAVNRHMPATPSRCAPAVLVAPNGDIFIAAITLPYACRGRMGTGNRSS
jgi:hypothetical protein